MPADLASELFYLVDEKDQVLGSIQRSQAHQDKTKIHRAIYIVITNSHDQVLLQQRSLEKDTFPGYWDIAVAGHVNFGESYDLAAIREAKEELGLTSLHLNLLTKKMIRFSNETEFDAIYHLVIDHNKFSPDPTEVQQLKWVDKNSLNEFVQNEPTSEGLRIVLRELALLD